MTLAVGAAMLLSACASTSVQEPNKPKSERAKVAANMQEVKLTSSPDGASCDVIKDGDTLGSLAATPGFVTIKRSNFKSVQVTCSKTGYETTTSKLKTIAMDKAIDGNIGAAISLFKMAQQDICVRDIKIPAAILFFSLPKNIAITQRDHRLRSIIWHIHHVIDAQNIHRQTLKPIGQLA